MPVLGRLIHFPYRSRLEFVDKSEREGERKVLSQGIYFFSINIGLLCIYFDARIPRNSEMATYILFFFWKVLSKQKNWWVLTYGIYSRSGQSEENCCIIFSSSKKTQCSSVILVLKPPGIHYQLNILKAADSPRS